MQRSGGPALEFTKIAKHLSDRLNFSFFSWSTRLRQLQKTTQKNLSEPITAFYQILESLLFIRDLE